ncbi:MAG: thiamine pyrophosphate-binding protein [Chloroflexota bacterium]|nr:thiamine pyrophosphate-binding protein [Chloroflexota bacterium]
MTLTAARYFAQELRRRGVRRVFGLPGTETIEIVEAIRQEGIEFFLTHHEATSGFVAGMAGSLEGVPGVCVVSAGPGATNAISGITAAHLDRRPLLVVVGDHEHRPELPTHQRLPLELYASVARAAVSLEAASIAEQVDAAFRTATGDPPGPVAVSFPTAEAVKEIVPPDASARGRAAARGAVPDLTAALDAIRASRRAMIVAGLGVATSGAGDALVRLADRLGCPVADTPQAKGWFPNSHPLFAGTYATHRNAAIVDLANASDLVIAAGLDTVEFLRKWQVTSPVVAIGAVGTAEPALPARVHIEGPLRAILEGLAADAAPAGSHPASAAAASRSAVVKGILPTSDHRSALWPQTVVEELRRALPADGVVTVDVGSHKLLMVLQWSTDLPNTFLNSSGLSSMGTGLPFAMAAKLTWPDRPVASVIGDGGFLMYAGELETLARTRLPIALVVMNDAALFSIKIKQVRRSYPAVGTDFGPIAVAEIARGFGLRVERVADRAQCGRALRAALASDGPTVIEAMIDPAGYELSQ